MNIDTLIPGIVLQWPCISNRRWMRLWGPTWWIAVCFTALLSPSSIWACKKMAWDSPWGYRPCGCSATWIQLVTVACANNKEHACIHPSIYTHGAKNPFTHACTHTHTHIHTSHSYIPRIHMCVTKVEGCGICHKYPNIQADSLKYYILQKIVLQVTFTHTKNHIQSKTSVSWYFPKATLYCASFLRIVTLDGEKLKFLC